MGFLNWMMQYSNNAASTLLIIMLCASVACGFSIFSYHDSISKTSDKEEKYEYKRNINVHFMIITIGWIIYVLFASVPKPDYIYRVHEKVVIRNINAGFNYMAQFNNCMSENNSRLSSADLSASCKTATDTAFRLSNGQH